MPATVKAGLVAMLLLLGFHFGSLVCLRFQPEIPPADRLPIPSAWYAACNWVRENTPPQARFFTPRLSQTFKWYTGRPEVVTWKDVPQDARDLVEWWRRMQEIYATGQPEPGFRWYDSPSEIGTLRLGQLGHKYNVQYAIISKAPILLAPALPDDSAEENYTPFKPLRLPVAYENEGYVIYRLGE